MNMLHTSQISVLDPKAVPDWYESSKKYPIVVPAWYGKSNTIWYPDRAGMFKSDTKPIPGNSIQLGQIP
jgi:hypothetical protein